MAYRAGGAPVCLHNPADHAHNAVEEGRYEADDDHDDDDREDRDDKINQVRNDTYDT